MVSQEERAKIKESNDLIPINEESTELHSN